MARVPNSGPRVRIIIYLDSRDADRASQPALSASLMSKCVSGTTTLEAGWSCIWESEIFYCIRQQQKVHSTEAGEPANLLAFASLGRNVMTISPCRRHDDDMFHVEQFALSAQNPRILVGIDREAENRVHFYRLFSAKHGSELPTGERGEHLGSQFAAG